MKSYSKTDLHREAEKKEPILFCEHLFSTWQKVLNFFHIQVATAMVATARIANNA